MNTYYLDDLLQTQSDRTTPAPLLPASVLTIGNFDGVHRGHQAMLAETLAQAKQQGVGSAVMIFEPQPREYFAALKGEPMSAPARLTSLDEKQALLAHYGVDTLIIASFDNAFRSLSATEFADILAQTLRVKALVLGDDFRFGHDRTGDSEFLRHYGLPVTTLDTVIDNTLLADRISSTRVRELLAAGKIELANQLLDRDYTMTGTVVGGDQIGRTLAFPTANISLNRLKPALHGVFGVDVVILDEQGGVDAKGWKKAAEGKHKGLAGLRPNSLFGTANIGTRPSVDKPADWRLEVYFPDFKGDLYGKTLQVRFLHYLHAERKYDGLEALKAGINQDVVDLRAWHAAHSA